MKHIIKDIGATFFAILLFFTLIFLAGVFTIQTIFQEENISKMINEMDLTTEIQNRPELKQVDDILNDVYLVSEEYGIPKEFVDATLNHTATKEWIGNITYQILEETVTNSEQATISSDQLLQLIEEHFDEFEQESGITLTEDQKDTFLSLTKEHANELLDQLPTTQELREKIQGSILNRIEFLLSPQIITITVGVLFVLMILILLCKWKEKTWLLYFATPLLFAGILLPILGILSQNILPILIESSNDLIYLLLEQIAEMIKKQFINLGILEIILSIFCFILYFILKKVSQKKEIET